MAEEKGLRPDYIIPNMDEWEVFPREAAAVAMMAIQEGVAGKPTTYDEELENAGRIIKRSRGLTQTMMSDGFIALPQQAG
jgi:malate dehydrogenase (oxaloacetate-decarboxylating)